ncbi:MAG: hypothetical protein KDK40_03885, partial [Chlamydiia bacterium]|nr:hypothetical protein [Chlamydiia bacterium]
GVYECPQVTTMDEYLYESGKTQTLNPTYIDYDSPLVLELKPIGKNLTHTMFKDDLGTISYEPRNVSTSKGNTTSTHEFKFGDLKVDLDKSTLEKPAVEMPSVGIATNTADLECFRDTTNGVLSCFKPGPYAKSGEWFTVDNKLLTGKNISANGAMINRTLNSELAKVFPDNLEPAITQRVVEKDGKFSLMETWKLEGAPKMNCHFAPEAIINDVIGVCTVGDQELKIKTTSGRLNLPKLDIGQHWNNSFTVNGSHPQISNNTNANVEIHCSGIFSPILSHSSKTTGLAKSVCEISSMNKTLDCSYQQLWDKFATSCTVITKFINADRK